MTDEQLKLLLLDPAELTPRQHNLLVGYSKEYSLSKFLGNSSFLKPLKNKQYFIDRGYLTFVNQKRPIEASLGQPLRASKIIPGEKNERHN